MEKDKPDVIKDADLADTSSRTATRSIDTDPFLEDSINSISDISTLRVSSLGSTCIDFSDVSTSQVSPDVIEPSRIQDLNIKTRRELPDEFHRQGKLCCFIAHRQDLDLIETALRCRLITRLEFEYLKLKRDRDNTLNQLYDIREILLLLRSDTEGAVTPTSNSNTDN